MTGSGKPSGSGRSVSKAAPSRKVVDVTPARGDSWDVRVEGRRRASGKYAGKARAVERAKELARKAPLGRVRIKDRDGKIEAGHTYGKDPERHPR
jgi:hypothetical protein